MRLKNQYANRMKHLPVLVFNANKEFEAKDSAISSIYYDNPETWELYMGRLKKTEGAEAIRLRWYGSMETETIFLERKTHREDWTGEKSVKARFSLKEKNMNAFMSGKMRVEQVFEKARKEGKKSEREICSLEQLAREFQYSVITKKLVPVTRSFYNRTAFQLPGDARVRISLDTELTMTREDNLDGRERAGKNWRRMDIGIDWPFSQLPASDVERFPYAVLEVKLQTQAGQDPPEWVRELISSHLVEAVPKFSKFIHGTATMFPTRINLLPFWMPQMDVDIRKPANRYFEGIRRPEGTTTSASDDIDDDDSTDPDSDSEETRESGTNGTTPLETAESDQSIRRLREARDALEQYDIARNTDPAANTLDIEERIAATQHDNHQEEGPLYDSDDEDVGTEELEEAKRIGGWHYRLVLITHHLTRAAHQLTNALTYLSPSPKPTPIPGSAVAAFGNVSPSATEAKRFKAPKGKRIHVPVRVEPKVHFAAERTFLSWLDFSIILSSVAAALLNFGDQISLWSAIAFTVVACAALFYSMFLYLWRVKMIRERRGVRYHDRWGPSVLCMGLLVALAVNFGIRLGDGGWLD